MTYSHVVGLASLQTICAIVAWNNWPIQMDMHNGYVNAYL